MAKENKFSKDQLQELREKPLEEKIQISIARIIEWYEHWNGQVAVAFSGGKDSTVLLHLVRRVYPEVVAMYVDTGLEYPELREFVKTIDNVDWIKPKKTFLQILKEYGYPLISKEVARDVAVARNKPDGKTAEKFNPESDYVKKYGERWCLAKYKYLIDAPFKITNQCCRIMKKDPGKKYEKETGRKRYVGTLTEESALRKQIWLQQGCNAFEGGHPQSTPMAFWTEQDVLRYIQKYNLKVAPVYGELVEDKKGKLKFTGCQRTGCVFCGFGCQTEKKPNRFQQLKETHPTLYNYCMRGGKYNEDGLWVPDKGLGMDKVLKYIGVETDYDPPENIDEVTKNAVEEVKKLKQN